MKAVLFAVWMMSSGLFMPEPQPVHDLMPIEVAVPKEYVDLEDTDTPANDIDCRKLPASLQDECYSNQQEEARRILLLSLQQLSGDLDRFDKKVNDYNQEE